MDKIADKPITIASAITSSTSRKVEKREFIDDTVINSREEFMIDVRTGS